MDQQKLDEITREVQEMAKTQKGREYLERVMGLSEGFIHDLQEDKIVPREVTSYSL